MDCPKCQTPMAPGRARISATILGFLAVGFSYKHLWFEHAKDATDRKRILHNSSSALAFHCADCGTTVLLRESDDYF